MKDVRITLQIPPTVLSTLGENNRPYTRLGSLNRQFEIQALGRFYPTIVLELAKFKLKDKLEIIPMEIINLDSQYNSRCIIHYRAIPVYRIYDYLKEHKIEESADIFVKSVTNMTRTHGNSLFLTVYWILRENGKASADFYRTYKEPLDLNVISILYQVQDKLKLLEDWLLSLPRSDIPTGDEMYRFVCNAALACWYVKGAIDDKKISLPIREKRVGNIIKYIRGLGNFDTFENKPLERIVELLKSRERILCDVYTPIDMLVYNILLLSANG